MGQVKLFNRSFIALIPAAHLDKYQPFFLLSIASTTNGKTVSATTL